MNLYYHNTIYGRLCLWCLTPLSSIILLYHGGKTRYNHIPNGLIYKAYVNYEHSDGQQLYQY